MGKKRCVTSVAALLLCAVVLGGCGSGQAGSSSLPPGPSSAASGSPVPSADASAVVAGASGLPRLPVWLRAAAAARAGEELPPPVGGSGASADSSVPGDGADSAEASSPGGEGEQDASSGPDSSYEVPSQVPPGESVPSGTGQDPSADDEAEVERLFYQWMNTLPEEPYTPVAEEEVTYERMTEQWLHYIDPGNADMETIIRAANGGVYPPDPILVQDGGPHPTVVFGLSDPVVVAEYGVGEAGLGMDVLPFDGGIYYDGELDFLGDGVFRLTMTKSENGPPDAASPPDPLTVEMKLEWPQEAETLIITLLAAEGPDGNVYAPYLGVPQKFITWNHPVYRQYI